MRVTHVHVVLADQAERHLTVQVGHHAGFEIGGESADDGFLLAAGGERPGKIPAFLAVDLEREFDAPASVVISETVGRSDGCRNRPATEEAEHT